MNNINNSFRSFVRVIIQHNNRFLVIKECKKGYNYWNFPGGKIETDEDKLTAARREIKEEVNLELKELHFLTSKIYTFPFFGNWNGHYFVADVICPETLHINEPTKCYGYCWMSLDEINDLSPFAGDKKILNNYIINQPIKTAN